MSQKDGTVHLWDLPLDYLYLELSPTFHKKVLAILKKYAIKRRLRELARKINLPYSSLYNAMRNKTISLRVLLTICEYFKLIGHGGFSKETIERNVTSIKSNRRGVKIRYPKFPMNFACKDGAIIISAFLHDGGISSQLEPHYRNNDKILRKLVYTAIYNVVGPPLSDACNPSKVSMWFPKILGLILVYGLGMKHVDKISNPQVPKFLFRSNREVRAEYVRQAIDDDGWIDTHSRNVGIELAVDSAISEISQLLLDDKAMIESLGIHVYRPYFKSSFVRKDGRKTNRWYIIVKGKKSFMKLLECPLESKHKREALEKIANSFVQDQFPKNRSFQIYLKNVRNLSTEGILINRKTLAKRVDRTEKTVNRILKEMRKKGVLKMIETGKGGYHSKLAKYKLN